MNLGIKAARAEIIVRLDAHAEYPAITSAMRSPAPVAPKIGSAGGRIVPRTTAAGRGPAPWRSSRRTGSAWRRGLPDRLSSRPRDTVPFGTFWRAVLHEVAYTMSGSRATRTMSSTRASKGRLRDRLRSEHSYPLPESGEPEGLVGRLSSPACGTSTRCASTRTRGSAGASSRCASSYTWRSSRGLVVARAVDGGRGPAARSLCRSRRGLLARKRRGAGGRLRVATTFAFYHLSYARGPSLDWPI